MRVLAPGFVGLVNDEFEAHCHRNPEGSEEDPDSQQENGEDYNVPHPHDSTSHSACTGGVQDVEAFEVHVPTHDGAADRPGYSACEDCSRHSEIPGVLGSLFGHLCLGDAARKDYAYANDGKDPTDSTHGCSFRISCVSWEVGCA